MPHPSPLSEASRGAPFVGRHIGPSDDELARMLEVVGYPTLDALVDAAVPAGIRTPNGTELPAAATELGVLEELRALARRNQRQVQMIGLGYYDTITPPVVVRRILESPAWYTAYTPYQPEISQGRLEALLNYQTMVADLTGLTTANASLLDEGTAAAEAMTLMRRSVHADSDRLVVDADCLPQTLAVVRTRAEPLGITVEVADLSEGLPGGELFGALLQNPGASGQLRDLRPVIDAAHERGALVTVAADLLSLALLESPGQHGADITVGASQRFGVPLGYGGPHAGFIAVRAGLERGLPGRLVGVSVDADGAPAYRLALQTREQHIRRERATSNICTAQVLLAVVASMYAVWHGPDGLREIATRVHRLARTLAAGLRAGGVEIVHDAFFDTVLARVPERAEAVVAAAADLGVNLGLADADHVRIACDEVTTHSHLELVWKAFGTSGAEPVSVRDGLPESLRRATPFLTHPVFATHRSETSMLRYMRRLGDKDYALDRGMIPLGSCTMKLNATTEMEPITWPGFASIHPFVPVEQAQGYLELIRQLERWLAAITGYDAVSVQPNAGSQGELSGLLAIRAYHRSRGDEMRDVCLIPSSAHGTNAASAVMAGMRVVVVAAAGDGTIDTGDLRAQLDAHGQRVAAIMVTYPSTHGVYEEGITEICRLVHEAGGQVYVDGANLNALVGLAKPGEFGADVSHLNLHKTFCIPHGGGGPGVGPVAVRSHLAAFLPNHPLLPEAGPASGVGPVSAAPFGSAGVLPISWAYIRMMGSDGLRLATQVAVLAANYIAARLRDHYPVLYVGRNGLVAHECIVDLRPLTKATGVTVEDVAKRLIDYGFHAPTMSFPVAGTLMIEPTESEDLAEIDRFCDAMISIRAEIDKVAAGEWPADDNPLRNAPHPALTLVGEWTHPYDRATAVYPSGDSRIDKYWPPVRRVDSAYGDRHLVCACPPPEAFGQH
ncbi:MAG: aminomethyl-transferring glycine dehydrogenase [Jiangellaceae bacterium]|nr:aminomethyl-transferring glycine dehydrogenase [Jiangellaceae bacterium]